MINEMPCGRSFFSDEFSIKLLIIAIEFCLFINLNFAPPQ